MNKNILLPLVTSCFMELATDNDFSSILPSVILVLALSVIIWCYTVISFLFIVYCLCHLDINLVATFSRSVNSLH